MLTATPIFLCFEEPLHYVDFALPLLFEFWLSSLIFKDGNTTQMWPFPLQINDTDISDTDGKTKPTTERPTDHLAHHEPQQTLSNEEASSSTQVNQTPTSHGSLLSKSFVEHINNLRALNFRNSSSSEASLISFKHALQAASQGIQSGVEVGMPQGRDLASASSCIPPKNTVCNVCNKVFSFPVALKLHMRTHTGEKPFACPYCPYRTSQKGNLTTHVRTHTGEEPFICALCPCRFKSGSALNSHLRTRHP